MATQATLAAMGVGPASIGNAAAAVGTGIVAIFVNPLTVGAIGGVLVGIGVYALVNRRRLKRQGVEELATAQEAPAGG